MKKLFLLLTFVTLSVYAVQAQTPPQFKFAAESHNFGKIKQNKPVTVVYKFTNVGDNPLIIMKAEASCGCTTPILSPKAGTPIKKGQSGSISVTYDAKAEGAFTKLVTLTANIKGQEKVLTLKGEVVKNAVK